MDAQTAALFPDSFGDDGLTGSTGFAVLRPKVCREAALVYLATTDPTTIKALANVADGGAYPAVLIEADLEDFLMEEKGDLGYKLMHGA